MAEATILDIIAFNISYQKSLQQKLDMLKQSLQDNQEKKRVLKQSLHQSRHQFTPIARTNRTLYFEAAIFPDVFVGGSDQQNKIDHTHKKFTKAEQQLINAYIEKYATSRKQCDGTDVLKSGAIPWEQAVAQYIPNRNANDILKYWQHQCTLNKSVKERESWKRAKQLHSCGKKNGKWSQDEDELLQKLILQYGAPNMAYISTFFKGRSCNDVNIHWTNCCNVKKKSWNKAETMRLIIADKAYGGSRRGKYSKYRAITDHIPGRSPIKCREQLKNKTMQDKKEPKRKRKKMMQLPDVIGLLEQIALNTDQELNNAVPMTRNRPRFGGSFSQDTIQPLGPPLGPPLTVPEHESPRSQSEPSIRSDDAERIEVISPHKPKRAKTSRLFASTLHENDDEMVVHDMQE
eukprot:266478_1